ncbi:MAG: circadian clock KaiB family protein [Methanocella sp.]
MYQGHPSDTWKFEFYFISDNRRSELAMDNLRGICHDYLDGHYHVDMFDLKKRPEIMAEKKLCVAPTLIKKYPLPERMLVGDLSMTDRVLESLDICRPNRHTVGNAYRDGLNKQGLSFKHGHVPH